VNPFEVRFVPVRQSVNSLTGGVTATNVQQFLGFTQRLWPVQQIVSDVRATYTTNAPVLQASDANGAWSQILAELNALRTADGSAKYYAGVVRTTYTAGVAGLAYVPGRASLVWDFQPSADEFTAHELGHNFSRFHAPCGNPGGPDPNYPYAGGTIGVYGYDMPFGVLRLPTEPDIMSYCNRPWVSDYNYVAVLNYRANTTGAGILSATSVRRRALLVWGRMNSRGLILEPAFALDAIPAIPEGRGSAQLDLLDSAGRTLYSSRFEPQRVADSRDATEAHFAFAIPLDGAQMGALQAIRVRALGRDVERRAIAANTSMSSETPRLRGGRDPREVRVEWRGAHIDAVMVRDANTGAILGILRDSQGTFLAAGPEVDMVVSDGVRSAVLRSRVPG
jgi:hypothetical protein